MPTFNETTQYRGHAVGIGGVVVVGIAIVVEIAKVRGLQLGPKFQTILRHSLLLSPTAGVLLSQLSLLLLLQASHTVLVFAARTCCTL